MRAPSPYAVALDLPTSHYLAPVHRHSEGADDQGHLTYYRRADGLSFTWTGWYPRRVEVATGGAGEPITHAFTVTPATWDQAHSGYVPALPPNCPGTVSLLFQIICDHWTEHVLPNLPDLDQ